MAVDGRLTTSFEFFANHWCRADQRFVGQSLGIYAVSNAHYAIAG